MARVLTRTKLSLDRWARIMGINPLHFNQVFFGDLELCGQPWFQHAWQDNDRLGREDLAQAIAQAESNMEAYLGYRLIPTHEVDEWAGTIRPNQPEWTNISVTDLRGYQQVVKTQWMEIISGGIESRTPIIADAAIAYTDLDGDGYAETATVTPAVTFSNECEVALYYPVSNALVSGGGLDEWEIKPISVSIDTATGIATITFKREQLVLPAQLEAMRPGGVDGADDAMFLTAVDVYRKYNDPQRQVQFLWEPCAGVCGACGGSGCTMCAYSTQEGCLIPRGDPRLGMVAYHPATWDSDDLEFDDAAWAVKRQPDLTRLWYYAGFRDRRMSCPTLEMSDNLAYAVAVYAASLLDRPPCACNNVSEFIEQWRLDLARITERSKVQITKDDLENPFGTKQGAITAWRRVTRKKGNAIAAFA